MILHPAPFGFGFLVTDLLEANLIEADLFEASLADATKIETSLEFKYNKLIIKVGRGSECVWFATGVALHEAAPLNHRPVIPPIIGQ